MFAKLPLTALRTFESAARLGSFKAAADELAVTPAAVSHQVKTLEQTVGVLLFERTGQGVRLTDIGQQLQHKVHGALRELLGSVHALAPIQDSQQLTLSTTAAFASLWLIPRLGDFHRRYPDIHVRVETDNHVVDLQRDGAIHLALRAVIHPDPGLYQVELLDEFMGVYSQPGWEIAEQGPLELISVPWQSQTPLVVDWPTWCARAGHQDWPGRARLRQYDDEHYALQAAIAGHGLVLASSVLVADSLARGLLQAYRAEVRLNAATYCAVCVPGHERRTPVREFIAWLQEQALSMPRH
ncbi:LysR substrate-binding domain-containing protein [Pseudomonas sp.]|uniref:LysR substrate-binding domain-containing protein n=1 Tax=Pseudomonas sp. TaxID=306 RepID=UPI003CC50C60